MSEPFRDISDEEIEELTSEGPSELSELVKRQKAVIDGALEVIGTETPDEIKIKARKFAIQHLDVALRKIASLVNTAEKDSTQLAAARTIVNIAQSTSVNDDTDPLNQLFSKIMGNSDTPESQDGPES